MVVVADIQFYAVLGQRNAIPHVTDIARIFGVRYEFISDVLELSCFQKYSFFSSEPAQSTARLNAVDPGDLGVAFTRDSHIRVAIVTQEKRQTADNGVGEIGVGDQCLAGTF